MNSISEAITIFGSTVNIYAEVFSVNNRVLDSETSEIRKFELLRDLKVLDLSDSKIKDIVLRYIGRINSLEVLDLSNTSLNNTGLKYIQNLRSLKVLKLRNNSDITDNGIKYLKKLSNLEYLNLEGTSVSDKCIEYLKHLNKLSTIKFSGNRIGYKSLKILSNTLKNCEVIMNDYIVRASED